MSRSGERETKTRILVFALMIGAAVLLTGLAGCRADPLAALSVQVGVDLTGGELICQSDTHGGFHGDGTGFAAVRFEGGAVLHALQQDARWRPLPLSETAQALIYGLQRENSSFGPYLCDAEGSPLFPEVQRGFYLLTDRHDRAAPGQEEGAVLEHGSINVTVAVYDTDTQTLYIGMLDT